MSEVLTKHQPNGTSIATYAHTNDWSKQILT